MHGTVLIPQRSGKEFIDLLIVFVTLFDFFYTLINQGTWLEGTGCDSNSLDDQEGKLQIQDGDLESFQVRKRGYSRWEP